MSGAQTREKSSPSVFPAIIWGVVLPSIVLEKGSPYLGALGALGLGLAFPMGYGIWSYLREKSFSWIALLGLLNVFLSGVLALSGKGGIWFALKEAAFPLLIGLFVLASTWTARPFVSRLLLNPQLARVDLIEERIQSRGRASEWRRHERASNILFSGSFFMSAALNFFLARRIFVPASAGLDEAQRQVLLNEQLGAMNRNSYLVITLPTVLVTIAVFLFLLRGLKRIANLDYEEVFSKPGA